jgi:hypothetical protein
MKCGFPHFTLKAVTADSFYKLSHTSAATTTIRENEKVPANNPLTVVQSGSPFISVMRLVGKKEKNINLDTAFLTVMESSFT